LLFNQIIKVRLIQHDMTQIKFLNILSRYILSAVFFCFLQSCKEPETPVMNYRYEMRNFIINISNYAKEQHPGFLIILQNGQELITHNGEVNGIIQQNYLSAIDATAREDLLFGYENDNEKTPTVISTTLTGLCSLYEELGIEALVIDYCSSTENVDYSYTENFKNGFVSFAAPERNLNVIPSYPSSPFHENVNKINTILTVKNFLYLINSENYETKNEFINAVSATNYDMVIIDLFHFEEAYTSGEITKLKTKPNGNKRLIICYMSIGEAEDYRYYWQNEWENNAPSWLKKENPDWEGNYKVEYWNSEWQKIIYGTPDSYLDKILSAGFDGVWLDLVDAFEYYE